MKRLFSLSLLGAALLATGHAPAQSALEDSLLFLGTTTSNASGTYAYVLWQPSDPSMLLAHRLAIYRKTGDAASANPYTRISIIEPAEDTRLISSMLPKAQNLGENLTDLDTALSELLVDVMPDTDVTLEQKISALIRESLTSREAKLQVTLLARQHPAIAFAAGEAFAEKLTISGPVTYELRDLDPATDKDLAVLGRVTLDGSSPLFLPAPDAPVELPETTSRGDLNCALRWGTPNNLRDLTPLHYGFDVWRVAKAEAIARGWHATPPAAASDFLIEPAAKKINILAVMPSQVLTAAEAATLTNPEPVFLIDDNGRYKDGGVPFNDGDEFYYFVTARDILGQGGVPSAGTLVKICDRLPTQPPRNVRVRNETILTTTTAPRDQHFVVEWDAPDLRPGESVSGYLVYRWYSPRELDSPQARHLDSVEAKPDWNLIAMLPGTQTTFVDDGSTPIPAWADFATGPDSQLNRPSMPGDADKTYFYTIRAIDNSICENVSGPSAPTWGVLRDREGPAAPIGTLGVWCCRPTLDEQGNFYLDDANAVERPVSIRLFVATQLIQGLEWAEFRFDPPGPIGGGPAPDPIFMGRRRFQQDSPLGSLYVQLDRTFPGYNQGGRFYCRVSTPEGLRSDWQSCNPDMLAPADDKRLQFAWTAGLNCGFEPADLCGDRHKLIDPATGEMTDICGDLTAAATSREYKIYRRVDDGPQTLIDQGEITGGATIMWCDENPPATLATLCYFAQTFDEHGNPSPLVRLGNCLFSGDPAYLPTPMLNELTPVLPMIPTSLRVSWFCNSAGVDRFEIWVARHTGANPSSPNANASNDLASHPNELSDDELEGLDFSVFETTAARILGAGTAPEYSVTIPVSPRDTYTVLVRAVGPGAYSSRSVGAFSNAVSGGWTIQSFSVAPEVPWPARPLPQQADFHEGIVSYFLDDNLIDPWRSVGVRIGEFEDIEFIGDNAVSKENWVPGDPAIFKYLIRDTGDVERHLYVNDEVAGVETTEEIPGVILPVALYRVQVPNAKYPVVPGDIVQVSPMMEKIAQLAGSDFKGPLTEVVDPFIIMLGYSDLPGLTPTQPEFTHAIFLIDRQPVLKGARYKYFLVRFDPTKEIERVIVTNEITIP